ncbi:glycosyltransferase family 4 protein [Mucilaginibacter litoreus]|uniref:Glycosyltransferase family 4 protein n=1 Tax=Mucilaginibacter litoreus TaxID=1048221 RepID=A0ABW3AWX0_9SPHI
MKILFILPEYYPHSGGGISAYYINYLNALRPHCQRIKVIVGSGYTQASNKFIHNDIEVEYLEPALYKKHLTKFAKLELLPGYRNDLAAAWAMWEQAAKGEDFDVVECTDFGLGFVPWVMEHNKPVVTRLHGSTGQIALYENSYQDLATDSIMQTELSLLPLCDCLITHSSANYKFWQNQLQYENIHYLLPIYSKQLTQPLNVNERNRNGLITARLQKWKGPVELSEAIRKIEAAPKVKWVGRDMPFFNGQTTSQYLNKNYPDVWNKKLLHQTAMPHTEIELLQRQAFFGIVPSVWDMFNFTALEFLAAGTPLICSDGAGVADIIVNGENGFKYPANDTDALAQCIKQVLALNPADYNRITRAGLNTLSQSLSAEALLPSNLNQYKDVVNNFSTKAVNSFLHKLYMPSNEKVTLAAALDKQPLKKLIKYVYKRSLAKLTGKKI